MKEYSKYIYDILKEKLRQMENKKFAKKTDIIIIGVVLIVALAGFLYMQIQKASVKDEYNYIVFNSGGEAKEVFYLGDYKEQVIIDLSENYPVSAQLEFRDHKARFVDVTCPDHLCEDIGWVSKEFEVAVCIPNQMSITAVTPQEAKEVMKELKDK